MFFFPFKDDNPTHRTTYVTSVLIGLCVMVFFWQLGLSQAANRDFILAYGVVPAALFGGTGAGFIDGVGAPAGVTIFTSMFLHGGLFHIAGNMLYLWIFGNNVEDGMSGGGKFILFYLLCGTAAIFAQSLINPNSYVPMIGASGAIAGVLGAYLMLFPRANVVCLVGFFIFFRVVRIPAFVVLLFWFALQFLGLGQAGQGGGGVAYMAHIGGFVAGILLIPFFKKPNQRFFAPANSHPFEVMRLQSHALHIPQMVRKKRPSRPPFTSKARQEQSEDDQPRPGQRHPWDKMSDRDG